MLERRLYPAAGEWPPATWPSSTKAGWIQETTLSANRRTGWGGVGCAAPANPPPPIESDPTNKRFILSGVILLFLARIPAPIHHLHGYHQQTGGASPPSCSQHKGGGGGRAVCPGLRLGHPQPSLERLCLY